MVIKQGTVARLLHAVAHAELFFPEDKSTKVTGVASDGEFWIAKVLSAVETLEADKKHVKLLAEEDEDDETVQVRIKARETISKLRKVAFALKLMSCVLMNL